jgi:hypothetical protein
MSKFMQQQIDKFSMTVTSSYCSGDTLASYQARSRVLLERLRKVDTVFNRLSVLGPTDFIPISEDLSDLEGRITETLSEDKKRHRHLGATSNGELVPDVVSRDGFSVSYFTYKDDSSRSHLSTQDGGVQLTVRGCSTGPEANASIGLKLPTNRYGDLHALPKLRCLLLALLETWHGSFGSVGSHCLQKAVSVPGDFCAGDWLYYFPFPYLGQCLAKDICWRPFHEGVLIEAAPYPLNANDPADLTIARRVREELDGFGLVWHSGYAIHGWPPDEEEWRYEEFITGAPSGRKYRVRCIDFDGYDAQRKVLLYAKLFRRLRRQPKQWGLRGWDGPVINEARRQVRAAQGEPIEWHIGLEEPADRVCTLLADYTDLTENQLKVIYTPLDLAFRTEVTPKEFPT